MSRWALWSAHRYVRAGASAPRLHGPDGRELVRPWRLTAAEIERRVRQLRAARPQPKWPRLLGVLLLALAGVAALHPVGSIPTHVAASASARPVPRLLSLRGESPDGDVDAAPTWFRWRSEGLDAALPRTVVLCDASYTEIARAAGVAGDGWQASGRIGELLAGGGTFHWFVEATASGRLVRSPLQTFAIR